MKRQFVDIGMYLALAIFIIASLSFSSGKNKYLEVGQFEISLDKNDGFVTKSEIKSLVLEYLGDNENPLMDTLNTENIELLLEAQAWICDAEVFKGFLENDSTNIKGNLKIEVELERPMLRIANGLEGFYVSEKQQILPLTGHGALKMPIISGHVDEEFALTELFDFGLFVCSSNFWNAQIQQIYVDKKGEMILIPRVGNHRIIFGTSAGFEHKFRNLKALYDEALAKGGLNQYDEINLKFKNQIVCCKK